MERAEQQLISDRSNRECETAAKMRLPACQPKCDASVHLEVPALSLLAHPFRRQKWRGQYLLLLLLLLLPLSHCHCDCVIMCVYVCCKTARSQSHTHTHTPNLPSFLKITKTQGVSCCSSSATWECGEFNFSIKLKVNLVSLKRVSSIQLSSFSFLLCTLISRLN